MKEFLLELYTEEMPARFQVEAEVGFIRIFESFFKENDIDYKDLNCYVCPTRITVTADISELIPEKMIEVKGPKLGAPDKALEGFCNSNNVKKADLIVKTIDNNQFYFFEKKQEKLLFIEVFSAKFQGLISSYIWPKSMVWADYEMRWARPVRNILCLYGAAHLEVEFFSIKSNNFTFGHKFQNFKKIEIANRAAYFQALEENNVIVSRYTRKSIIEQGINSFCSDNVILNKDDVLVDEISGITEFPVILKGSIDSKFMELPSEVLITSMKNHQKYLTLSNKQGELLPNFLFATNLALHDYTEIIRGNEKVLTARLSDALYFYNRDKVSNIEEVFTKLGNIVFHAKLGTIKDKAERIEALSKKIEPRLQDAARICKLDLVSEMVGEFPELQGIMGYYYAKLQGFSEYTYHAIKDHYKPTSADDNIPTSGAAILSVIDKLDSLVSLYLAGERATGSKDPYSLRRYCISIIRTIIANDLQYDLIELIRFAASLVKIEKSDEDINNLIEFFEERIKHYLKAEISAEILNVTVDLKNNSNLLSIKSSAEALQRIISSEKGSNVLGLYKRAKNVSSDCNVIINIDSNLSPLNSTELELYETIAKVSKIVEIHISNGAFEDSLKSILTLEKPMSDFFENNLVNSDNIKDTNIRKNILLKAVEVFELIADFSRL